MTARVFALLLTIALHVLLLAPAMSGGKADARSAAPGLAWIEVADARGPAAVVAIQPNVRLHPVKLDELPDVPVDDAVPDDVRRMATLTARIQGLWKLPRTRLAADFHCRARLRTGQSGSVDEVELENCDDSGPVRASIAAAIEHALPLPLPQERSGDIVLQFIAHAQANGASHTSIEPAAD